MAPVVVSSQHHSGSHALQVGSSSPEPNGDACAYQSFTSGAGTYTAYYLPFSTDTITYDWQEAYLRNAGTVGCGESGTQLFKVASNSQTWTQVSQPVAAGSHQAYFNVHEDGYGDPTCMCVDGVAVQ